MKKLRVGRQRLFLLSALAIALVLAGCSGPGGALEDQGDENEAPEAKLSVSKNTAWTDETVEFDGTESHDPDGNISQWHFSFGDGTEATASEEERAKMDHQYKHGGEFVATLTVRDSGGQQTGEKSATDSVELAINERQEVLGQVVHAPENESTGTFNEPVKAYEGVDRFELEVTVESTMPTGASEIEVRIVDPSGETITDGSVTVNAAENETLTLQDVITDAGTYQVEVEAHSGAANVHGEMRTYYDVDYPMS